jgi:predicted permease
MVNWKQEIEKQLAGLRLTPAREAEIVEELTQHLQDRYAELLAGGATQAEAARTTLAELQDHELLTRELRRIEQQVNSDPVVFGANRRQEMFGGIGQDIRFGLRGMRKNWGFTAIAVLSLALGIGANTALFSVVDAVLLKRLSVREPERLVLFNWLSGPKFAMATIDGYLDKDEATGLNTSTSFSYHTYQQFRAESRTLAEVFAFAPIDQLNVNAGEQAEITSGQLVSGSYYVGLGAPPLLGRVIDEGDDQATAEPVAVLSHPFWQRRFGGDAAVIGKSITINQVPVTIIGVAQPGFFGALNIGEAPDISLPLAQEPRLRQGGLANLNEPWNWWLRVMGRLKPGVGYEQVRDELATVLHRTALEGWEQFPAEKKKEPDQQGERDLPVLRVDSGSQGLNDVRKGYEWPLRILQFVVGLVLLIACANVANLLLARATGRQKEVAVRLALGASRWRVLRQLLTESLLLALLGGVVGVIFAFWAKDLLVQWNPWGNGQPVLNLNLDLRVLGFTTAVSLFTGLLFGSAPAWLALRVEVNPALKDGTRGSKGHSRSWFSKGLIVAQVAMSLVLLVGAGLFLRTLHNLQSVEVGFNSENLLLFRVDPRLNNYQDEKITRLYDDLVAQMERVPGVRSVTMSRHPLLAGSSSINGIYVQGQAPRSERERRVWTQRVQANFFATMEMPLLAGRQLTPQDDRRAPKVAIINQTLARQFFGEENPLGQRFGYGAAENSGDIEIVGVVKDAYYTHLRYGIPPTVYLPYLQQTPSQMNFALRTTGDPLSFVAAVREAVREVDKNLPLFEIKTQSRQIEQGFAQEQSFARLTAFFALLALLLSSIGLYGVLAYSVTQRTHEIGIRLALGAPRLNVLMLIIRQGMWLVGLGAIIGLIAAFNLTQLVESMLFEVKPKQPTLFAGVALVLALVGLAACYVPARRAAKTDPMSVLRNE